MSLLEGLQRGDEDAFSKLQAEDASTITQNLSELIQIAFNLDDRMRSFAIFKRIHEVLQTNPLEVENHFEIIVNTIEQIVDMHLSDEDPLHGAGTMFFTLIIPKFMADPMLVDRYARFLLKLMSEGGTFGQLAASPVTQAAQNRPKVIAPYVKELFEAIKAGNDVLLVALYGLYPHNKEGFEEEFQTIMDLYRTKPGQKSIILKVIGDIASSKPELVKPHLEEFLQDLHGMGTSYQALVIFTEVAKVDTAVVDPFIDHI